MRITRDVVVAGLLFGAPFVLYFPVTLGQQIFYLGDFQLQLYPMRTLLARALAEGRLPLWEPGIAMGFPLFAEGQVGALRLIYHLLYRVMPVPLALGYELLVHLGWMMTGLYCFARALRHRIPSAVLLAVILPGSAYLTDSLLSLGIDFTSSYLPWLLWLIEKFFAESRARQQAIYFALLALAMFFQFIGHPYLMLLDIGIVIVYAATWRWHHLDDSPERPRGWQPLLLAVAAIVVGGGLAAVQLLPTLEISRWSTRAGGVSYADFTIYSVAPQHLLLLFAPYAWGSPYDLPGGVGGYVGMLPLALALAAPFFRRDRRTWFWLLFALAALLLALGKYNPIYLVLYQLPFFNSLRIAGHFLWVYSFAVAMLAVITCDRILETAPQPGMISRRVGVVVLALAAVVAVEIVLTHQVSLRDWLTLWAWLPVPLALFSVGIVGGAWRREIPQALVAAAIVGFTIFDIIAFCAVYTQSKNGLMPLADFARAPQSLAALPTRPGESRILTLGAMVPPFAPAQESLFPDLSTLYGIESVKGTTGLMLRYARNYTDNFSPGMLNLTNARYLLLPRFPPDASGRVVSQPSDKFGLRLGTDKIELPAVPASAVQVESYIENAADTPDGTQVGGIVFFLDDGTAETMPLRVGIETANWAIEREPGRRMPPIATTFPIFSGASLRGHTFRARLDFSGGTRALVGIQLTADSRSDILRIEHIRGLDNQGGTTLLDYYLGASNHSTVYRNDLVTVIENSDALPRTFLTHAAQVLDDATTLARLRDYAFDPRQGALLAEGQALADRAPEQDEDESVQITLYQPERVQLNLTANRKAYLVLSDTWYPGWIARVDGKAAPVYRAYVTLRAVPVEAGTHTVEFEFRPTSFYQGAAISIATLLCLVIGVGWALK